MGSFPLSLTPFLDSGIFVVSPRIDEQRAGRLEVGGVASHDMEAMPAGGRGDQPIHRGDDLPHLLSRGGQLSPQAGGFKVDR